MADYDIRAAFEEMELELIRSMKRNLSRHLDWEKDEQMNWTMWQAEQLKALENFKKENKEIFSKKFSLVNSEIEKFLKETFEVSGLEQEKEILSAIKNKKSFKDVYEKGLEGSFFQLNEKKMNTLIHATTNDMSKAEYAMLRMVDDQYRKTIYKAQVMANSGAFTLQQSIDMATKDFLKAGINCVEYKNGRRVNIAAYAEMCIRTSTKRAALISEGEVRNAYGIHTVRISKYGGCSETCLPWQGKVYVDDVYSGGTKEEAEAKNLTLLSTAIAGGLFHPNCKHRSTTYFYDLKKSLGQHDSNKTEVPKEEQEHRKNQKHIQQQKRLEAGSLDKEKIKEARQKKEQWIEKDEKLGYEETVYDPLTNQNYKDVKLDETSVIETKRGDQLVSSYESNTSNKIFISKAVNIKRKVVHDINKTITEALEMIKYDGVKPIFILISEKEMSKNAIAAYNPIKNHIYINQKITDKKIKNSDDTYSLNNDILSTLVHELIHWKNANIYIKKHGDINNSNYIQYLNFLNNRAEKEVVKLENQGYNIDELSEYAKKAYINGNYDEVYTEYLTEQIIKRNGKKK